MCCVGCAHWLEWLSPSHNREAHTHCPAFFRGRYEVELFSQFFRLKGKTYDFKIQYKHVSRFYLLPRPNGAHVAFVISLVRGRGMRRVMRSGSPLF